MDSGAQPGGLQRKLMLACSQLPMLHREAVEQGLESDRLAVRQGGDLDGKGQRQPREVDGIGLEPQIGGCTGPTDHQTDRRQRQSDPSAT